MRWNNLGLSRLGIGAKAPKLKAARLSDLPLSDVRLLIVVDKANYRTAIANVFMPEDLYGQLHGRLSPVEIHILAAAVRWSSQIQEVAIFACEDAIAYSEDTYLKVRIMGSGIGPIQPLPMLASPAERSQHSQAKQSLIQQVAEFCPTHMVMCTRDRYLLDWAVRNKIRTIALLFNWQPSARQPFNRPENRPENKPEPLGFWQRWQHSQYVSLLNHDQVKWVGGQGIQTSALMEQSGIRPSKIIPWEWSQPRLVDPYPFKEIAVAKDTLALIYIGPLIPSAGVGDLLQAILRLQKSFESISLQLIRDTLNQTSPVGTLADTRDSEWLRAQVQELALADIVCIEAGLSPEQMLSRVRAADLVVVPRLAKSDANLPLCVTLAMAARTPVVACDHPYLEPYLYHNGNAMIFPAGNPLSMAHRIEHVMGQPALYAQLSESSDLTLDKIKVPARWDALVDAWLRDRVYDRQRLSDFALTSGRYDTA